MRDPEGWLRLRIAAAAGVAPDDLDAHAPLDAVGLSSREAVSIAGEIEETFAITVSATLLWEYPSIHALARFLAGDKAPVTSPAPYAPSTACNTHDFAIAGMACHFPGAPTVDAFWKLLLAGESAITEVPEARWRNSDFYDPRPGTPGKTNARYGGFIGGIDHFDHEFFGISRREALRMDPAQRLLLETAWHAIEDAAQPADALAGSDTGVFIGISGSEYVQLTERAPRIDAYRGPGSALSIAANRISYVLDLRGPSLIVDTACAASLSALHLACRALAAGECSAALVGGVSVILRPEASIALAQSRLLTPGDAAKPFDTGADGYVRGEGCGVVMLKPLAAALEAGDRIYAVVRGVATGHMGRGNGLGAPSSAALGQVIAAAHGAARTSPAGMGYVEVQGTGTRVGDAIEVHALKTQCAGAPEDAVCVLGTAKVNIGHLEAASGVAGLMKAALCLHHGVIPPHRNLEQLSPDIHLDGTPLVIRQESTPWPRDGAPRIAGVTAFGFGGASAHAVLAEAPETPPGPAAEESQGARGWACHLLALSAKAPEALQRLARRYAEMLQAPGAPALEDLCFTANTGRVHFALRRVFYAREAGEMAAQLQAFSAGGSVSLACPELPAAAHTVATAYLAGNHVDWHAWYKGQAVRKVGLPGYPFSEERCWLDEAGPASGGNGRNSPTQGPAPDPGEAAGHLRLALGATAPAQRVARLQAYLLGLIAEALGAPVESLDPERNLLELGLDSLTATEVLGRVSLDLDLVVYPREAFDHPTPARLAAHLVRALQVPETPQGNGKAAGTRATGAGIDFFRLRLRQHRTDDGHGHPNPTAVFLLSAPRSGSTLLRVMLAGHPDLFVPPELHLLLFDTMAQRRDELAGTGLDAGLVRALMELQDIGEAEARRQAVLFERGALPVKQAFHVLQQAAAPRLLVDKSPTYAGSLETLQRAERLFDHPKYVYLVRHPYAVIESLVRTRLEQLAAGAPDQPYQNAEAMWTLANHNIRTFLKQVPEERRHGVDYEFLVRAPETALRALCAFLELPYHPAVLTPYEGPRMADEAVGGVTGDPHFLRRGAIEPGLAGVWRDIALPGPLGSCTRRLARELGYTLPREPGDDDRLASPRTVFEEGGI